MNANENVKTILGDPKKAIRKLAFPTILSMLLLMVNNLTDAIFVAGLGGDAIAAIGFITPLFLVIIGIGNAIGAGANAYIARALGERNQMKVNDGATHSVIIGIIVSAIITVAMFVAWEPILKIMGAGSAIGPALDYGNIIFGCTILFILTNVFIGILRSEGDVKKATVILAATAIVNMILDPIFIYGLGLGIEGAAIATVLADAVALAPMLYWFFIKKSTFIRVSFKGFSYSKKVTRGIINVAIPSSAETLIMSALTIVINSALVFVGGTDSVAVYTSGMRVTSFLIIPVIGIATALLSVCGAAYGARDAQKFKVAFKYALKLGLKICGVVGIFLFIFSNQVALLFSYSPSTAHLTGSIAQVLMVFAIDGLLKPFGVVGNAIFQSVSKGTTSLALTFMRCFLFEVIFVSVFTFVFGWGLFGVYGGIILGNVLASIITYVLSNCYVKKLCKTYNKEDVIE